MVHKHIVLPNALQGLVPVELYLYPDGSVLFMPTFGAVTTYEYQYDGVSSIFDKEGFTLWEPGSIEFKYEYEVLYRYKSEPLMAGWLRQQELSINQ
jgi:hypothetical protein